MKIKIKKFFSSILDFLVMIFFSAAENQILMSHRGTARSKYRSYTHLKNHQKKIRKFTGLVFLGLSFFFFGIIIGPALLPKSFRTEVHIPNGRGDILVANVNENQATLVFKTLDAENGYKPLATKAYVDVCEEESCQKILRRVDGENYAVTHIIKIDSLKKGKMYYFRITASDSPIFTGSKTVSSWGDGNDPIRALAIEEDSQENSNKIPRTSLEIVPEYINGENTPDFSSENSNDGENINEQNGSLKISDVKNESYLQPKNKIQTIVSWKTNVPANSILLYREGKDGEEKEIILDKEKSTKHSIVIMTLKAGSAYFFKVKSEDENGNPVVSDEYSLRTPRPKETVLDLIADNFQSLFYQIKPK